MDKQKPTFAILITTKNRLKDLKLTLQKTAHLIKREDVECIICDDGSNDGTFTFIKKNYPKIQLIQNPKSKGLIYSRNRLFNLTTARYAISLDDDLNFLIENPLSIISQYFKDNSSCGVISFRIFWSKTLPVIFRSKDTSYRTKSYTGGAHVFRMKAWKSIPNYPSWFVFSGEEDFASFQLLKKGWKVHYVPDILVQHRVDMKARKKDKDYVQRQRRSLRSGWYLYFMCYPKKMMFHKFFASLWSQLKRKVFKGNLKFIKIIFLAMFDLIVHIPIIVKGNFRLSNTEYQEFIKLPNVKIYWKPEDE